MARGHRGRPPRGRADRGGYRSGLGPRLRTKTAAPGFVAGAAFLLVLATCRGVSDVTDRSRHWHPKASPSACVGQDTHRNRTVSECFGQEGAQIANVGAEMALCGVVPCRVAM